MHPQDVYELLLEFCRESKVEDVISYNTCCPDKSNNILNEFVPLDLLEKRWSEKDSHFQQEIEIEIERRRR